MELKLGLSTCIAEGIGEAEIVDSVQREQVVQELLPLIFTTEKTVALVETPVIKPD